MLVKVVGCDGGGVGDGDCCLVGGGGVVVVLKENLHIRVIVGVGGSGVRWWW